MTHAPRALALLALLSGGYSVAQDRPDAGSLSQQAPRFEPLIRPAAPAPAEAAPSAKPRAPGPRVLVRSIRIEGNRLLSEAQLAPTLAPYLQRTLDLAQLEQAANDLAQRYREDGWVVSAYLPAQDITSGDVLIRVDEARLGAVQLNAPERLRAPQAQRYFDALLVPGQPLNANDVDRAQQLSSELLGLDVNTRFRKSQSVGATDLGVDLRDKPLWAMDVMADNAGARSTGIERLVAFIELRNPLATGDIWNFALMKSQGSDSARVGVGVPVGNQGWRIGGSAARYTYRLISPEYASLHAKGTVDSLGLEAAYPLVRERQRSLSFVVNADHKTMDNRAGEQVVQTTSHYSSQSTSVSLQGRQADQWAGLAGQTQGLLALTAGRLNLNGSPTQTNDASTVRTDGQFTKLRAQLSRQQTLGSGLMLQLSHTQQWANKNLDSSEKFFIGGPDSVRAFPVTEAGGAEGRVSSAELQWQLSGATTLVAFYDHGQVRTNVNNQFSNAPALNRYSLEGAGLGLQWRPSAGWVAKATWARRLKDNPNPRNGKDQDGSLLRDRLWVSLAYSF